MNKGEILELIARHCVEVIPALKSHDFQREDRLKDLGANSLDRSDIIDMTMESLSLQIPRVEVYGTRNIGELVDLLHGKIEG